MSSQHQGSGDGGKDTAHDADHAFDGEPVKALAADEPKTPGWLPLLGIALFIILGVYAIAGERDERAAFTPPTRVAVAAQPAASAAGAGSAAARPRRNINIPRPSVSAAAPRKRLSPEEIQALKKRLEDAKKPGEAAAQ
jgi:hypothetical protein